MDNFLSSCSDTELWQQFRNGSEKAYSYIYKKYVPILYSYGYRIHPDEDIVKDCLQDLFVNLWISRENLGTTDSIKFYLFRSLRRKIAQKTDFAAKLAKKNDNPIFLPTEDSYESRLIELEENHIQLKEIDIALTYLSDRQREAIYLRFYQNISFEEIASIMGITQRAVYKLIYRAVDILKKVYAPKLFSSSSSLPVVSLITIVLIFQMALMD